MEKFLSLKNFLKKCMSIYEIFKEDFARGFVLKAFKTMAIHVFGYIYATCKTLAR